METQKELFENFSSELTLPQIQNYIKKVLDLRGFSNQTVQDKLLLLTEEVGELTKSVRKVSVRASVDHQRLKNYDSIESEIADVLIVLISVANILDIDIFECLKEKEKINIDRVWKINDETKKITK